MSEDQLQRYRLEIEYDGSAFVGWQVQTNGRSVQDVLEQALGKLYGCTIRVHGAGRTDTGVHASGQVAHIDVPPRYDANVIRNALNGHLPADVSVHGATPVDQNFHARFSASSREYVYTISHRRVSIDRGKVWVLYAGLNHGLIHEAVSMLAGTHDFTAFSKYSPAVNHCFSHVFTAEWSNDGHLSRFHIKANRFLQGMVRCLVGGLTLVGRGKLTPSEFHKILESRDRSLSPMLAPPEGLVLTAVNYDAEERKTVEGILVDIRPKQ